MSLADSGSSTGRPGDMRRHIVLIDGSDTAVVPQRELGDRESSSSLPANIFFFGRETQFFDAPKPPKKQTDAEQREADFLTQ